MSSGGESYKALSVNNYRQDFDLSSVHVPMTTLSNYILRNMDICATFEKRRPNAAYLLKAIPSLSGLTPCFPALPEGICPLAFPVLALGRKNLHVTLRSKGIPAFTWGGLMYHASPIAELPEADFLYQNLVLLPIHQSMEEADLQRMVEIMANVCCHED